MNKLEVSCGCPSLKQVHHRWALSPALMGIITGLMLGLLGSDHSHGLGLPELSEPGISIERTPNPKPPAANLSPRTPENETEIRRKRALVLGVYPSHVPTISAERLPSFLKNELKPLAIQHLEAIRKCDRIQMIPIDGIRLLVGLTVQWGFERSLASLPFVSGDCKEDGAELPLAVVLNPKQQPASICYNPDAAKGILKNEAIAMSWLVGSLLMSKPELKSKLPSATVFSTLLTYFISPYFEEVREWMRLDAVFKSGKSLTVEVTLIEHARKAQSAQAPNRGLPRRQWTLNLGEDDNGDFEITPLERIPVTESFAPSGKVLQSTFQIAGQAEAQIPILFEWNTQDKAPLGQRQEVEYAFEIKSNGKVFRRGVLTPQFNPEDGRDSGAESQAMLTTFSLLEQALP